MELYKFLRLGAVGPFSGFAWPTPTDGEPGTWVEASPAAPPPLTDAVRACSAEQLAYWVSDELWRFELEDPVVGARTVSGARGRLLEPVEAWGMELIAAYVPACMGRAAAIAAANPRPRVAAYAREAERFVPRGPAMAGYQAAHVAGIAALERGEGYETGARAERAWQSGWIAERIGSS